MSGMPTREEHISENGAQCRGGALSNAPGTRASCPQACLTRPRPTRVGRRPPSGERRLTAARSQDPPLVAKRSRPCPPPDRNTSRRLRPHGPASAGPVRRRDLAGRVGEGDVRQGIPGVGAKAPRRVRRAVSTGGVWAPEPRVLTELVQATGDQGYDSDPQRPPPSITPRSTTPATPSSTVWGPSDPFQPKPPTRRPPDTAGPGLPECSLPQPARGAWA